MALQIKGNAFKAAKNPRVSSHQELRFTGNCDRGHDEKLHQFLLNSPLCSCVSMTFRAARHITVFCKPIAFSNDQTQSIGSFESNQTDLPIFW
jgi:hypothetical protein